MNSPQTVDCLIESRWLLPIVPKDQVFENCCLVIDQGQIIDITPNDQITTKYKSDQHYSLTHHVLMPGLINAHGHAAMTLLRGIADDLPLMTWLQEHIWPAESEWVNEQFVYDGTQLAIAEMLLSGTTLFSDMYFFPEQAAQAAKETGIKAQITFPILDFPTNWAQNADEYIHKGLELHQSYRNSSDIQVGFGPHAPYTVSDSALQRVATLSAELQAPIHIHVHETAFEVSESLQKYGERPLHRLHRLGVITPFSQCVHMTQVDSDDIDLLSQSGAAVIHCPESNLKLASGICPVAEMLDAGITVGLGTDGAASNNDLSMLGEMQTAALVGKISANDASAVSASQTLEMATLGGARALGMANSTGSLEIGKAADVIALDLNCPSLLPLHNIQSALVYNNRDIKVSHVWVNGHMRVHDGKLLTLDVERLKFCAEQWRQKIVSKNVQR